MWVLLRGGRSYALNGFVLVTHCLSTMNLIRIGFGFIKIIGLLTTVTTNLSLPFYPIAYRLDGSSSM